MARDFTMNMHTFKTSKLGITGLAIAVAASLGVAPSVGAYEVLTHQKLTRAAFEASIMADVTRGPLSGLDVTDPSLRFTSVPAGPFEPVLGPVGEIVSLG